MSKTVVLEAIHTPSCGLDIHKDVIEACVIDNEGRKHRKTFDTMRNSLYALKSWLQKLKCLHVLMESTSIYWIPVYEILEEVKGMDVGVGNARNMKQVPGRPKTDKADSDWIARLCRIGFILKSYVVGRPFRELREYTRYHKKLVQERARQINRIEKLLQINGFKLSSVLSNIIGASGMKLLKKLSENGSVSTTDVLISVHGRVKKTSKEIECAINGELKLTSRILLKKMLSKLERCDEEIAEIYGMMVELSKPYRFQIEQLVGIPGVGELSAIYIIAEISTDISSFKTSGHITAWAGLAPKAEESAGKIKSNKIQKANIYIKSILMECAWGAVRTRNTRLSNWYWCNVKRIGEKKAVTGVSRKLLVYIYSMLKSGSLYNGSLDVADTEKRKAEKLESALKTVEHRSRKTGTQGHPSNINREVLLQTLPLLPMETSCKVSVISNKDTVLPKKRGRPQKKPVTKGKLAIQMV